MPMTSESQGSAEPVNLSPVHAGSVQLTRVFALSMVALVAAFLINNYLIFWQDWPGALSLLQTWFGDADVAATGLAWLQLLSFLIPVLLVLAYVWRSPVAGIVAESECLARVAGFIVRAAFWSVLLVGVADMLISLLRVEELLAALVGEELSGKLGRAEYRGMHVHYPLLLVALLLATFTRTLGFIWLTLLIVLAEFLIVISRFVFSYEQVFMGDLVRFWYAALFLFASAHTLVIEGHVRVDVLYVNFSDRTRALSNSLGVLLLGLPLCWSILLLGTWSRGSSINSPLLSFEISQSGYGMYVKYLMVGFLLIFALSMLVQFCAYLLRNVALLNGMAEVPASAGKSVEEGVV